MNWALYRFSRVTIAHYHKLGTLNNQRSIASQLLRPENWRCHKTRLPLKTPREEAILVSF